jgi:4-hydroxy-tetrahydrodipicolinate synthase
LSALFLIHRRLHLLNQEQDYGPDENLVCMRNKNEEDDIMAIFEGAGVALVTPFKENKDVNYEKLEELVEEQIALGTDSIIVCGTTGEAATMTHEEHLDVIKYVCQVTKKRIPVIAGTGSNCTDTAVYLSVEAEKYGADGLLLVSPYYNKATQNGIKAHFKAVADMVKIPILLYNVPGRTGVNIAAETIADLCLNVPNIVGVKEASGNFTAIADLMNFADGRVDLYSGNDDQIVPMMSLGGKGVISVLSNIAPAQTHEICEAYFKGEVKRSAALQLAAIPLINALFCEVNPIPVKAALNLMGKAAGPVRLPLTEMEPKNQERLKQAMKEYGIL